MSNTTMRASFIFYSSYYDAISELPPEEQGLIYKAIIDYGIAQIEPTNLTPAGKMCFKLIKPTIDAALSRYDASVENGKKGGRPKNPTKTQKKPSKNPKETQEEPTTDLEPTKAKPNKNLNKDMDIDLDLEEDLNLDLDIESNKPSNDGRLVGSIEALEILNEKLDAAYKGYCEKRKDDIGLLFTGESKYITRLHDLFEKMSYTKQLTINGVTMPTDKVLWDFIDIFRRDDDAIIDLIIDCFTIVDSNQQIANVFTYTISVFYNKMKGI